MGSLTQRRLIGAITIGLVAVVLTVGLVGCSGSGNLARPGDLIGENAPIGDTVTTEGELVSYSHRGLVLQAVDDRDGLSQIVVRTKDLISDNYAAGEIVQVEGVLVESGRIEDAKIVGGDQANDS